MRKLIQELLLTLQLWFLVYFLARLHKHYITSSESFQIIKNLTMKCKHKTILRKYRISFNMSALAALSWVYILGEIRAILPLTGKVLPSRSLAVSYRSWRPLKYIHMSIVYFILTLFIKVATKYQQVILFESSIFPKSSIFCIALFFLRQKMNSPLKFTCPTS